MLDRKIVAATAAFLIALVGLKLWFAPPKDLLAVFVMTVKATSYGILFYLGVGWIRDQVRGRARASTAG
jgi:uncharacterized membrane protein